MSHTSGQADVDPASLGFLTIYNPTLNDSDETRVDQILYYYSVDEHQSFGLNQGTQEPSGVENERLRQIGLAQGMVEFAKGFSDGHTIDAVDTERTRTILHEIEPNWWLLASINLTRFTRTSETSSGSIPSKSQTTHEYSAREVSSPTLLLQQVLRAHRIFLLHHGSSLADIFVRVGKPDLCKFLQRFWNPFVANWDVLLHGNPASEVFNALKLSAGGELGIGVGEEEWGSGEREVLEDFIRRTSGLIDIVVSRFETEENKAEADIRTEKVENQPRSSRPVRVRPQPSNGVIFSGIRAVSRKSIQDISAWMEDMYVKGEEAYGVYDNPSTARARTRRKFKPQATDKHRPPPADIPRSLFDYQSQAPAKPVAHETRAKKEEPLAPKGSAAGGTESGFDAGTMMKYLTFGAYGSKWSSSLWSQNAGDDAHPDSGQRTKAEVETSSNGHKPSSLPAAYFLIGLRGQVESDQEFDEVESGEEQFPTSNPTTHPDEWIRSRLILVERNRDVDPLSSGTDDVAFERVRVVVYMQPPFMFAFLFDSHADSLSMPSFYRAIHCQLGPLQRPLLTSTSPRRVRERIWEASSAKSTSFARSDPPLYSLIYDPWSSAVHSTIPNIPEVEETSQDGGAVWTRVEALTVHSQVLNAFEATRVRNSELERTCKTSRGWWVVWMRLPSSTRESMSPREAFLVRKATDYAPVQARKASRPFGLGNIGEGSLGPGKLKEGMGIGIDARQYIEGLLSLSR